MKNVCTAQDSARSARGADPLAKRQQREIDVRQDDQRAEPEKRRREQQPSPSRARHRRRMAALAILLRPPRARRKAHGALRIEAEEDLLLRLADRRTDRSAAGRCEIRGACAALEQHGRIGAVEQQALHLAAHARAARRAGPTARARDSRPPGARSLPPHRRPPLHPAGSARTAQPSAVVISTDRASRPRDAADDAVVCADEARDEGRARAGNTGPAACRAVRSVPGS